MKSIFATCLLLVTVSICLAQENVNELQPHKEYDNILVKKIETDQQTTSFVIWVKESVKAHKHEHHKETLYVIEGSAEMKVGDKTMKITAGDFFVIPENTVHSVKVTSSTPLKVISVQAPEFLGKDRVFVE